VSRFSVSALFDTSSKVLALHIHLTACLALPPHGVDLLAMPEVVVDLTLQQQQREPRDSDRLLKLASECAQSLLHATAAPNAHNPTEPQSSFNETQVPSCAIPLRAFGRESLRLVCDRKVAGP
jgi:hypothetical protein